MTFDGVCRGSRRWSRRSSAPPIRVFARRPQELVEAILDLHGAGLDRILEIVTGVADNGPAMLDRFSRDELVSSLLILHGLHPVDLDTRVHKAIETLAPALRSQGGAIELIRIEDGVVTVRLTRSGHGCSGRPLCSRPFGPLSTKRRPTSTGSRLTKCPSPAPVAVVPLSSLRRNSVGSSIA